MSEFPCTKNLLVRGEPFDFFCGGEGVEDFGKKFPAKPLQSKKYLATRIAMKKNACTDCEVKKNSADHKK